MIDTPGRLSAPTLAYANETFSYCIQHLLLRWLRLPHTLPEHEVLELRDDIQRVLGHLLRDLESNMPAMQGRMVLDMRGLADLLEELVAPFEASGSATEVPALTLVFSDVDSTVPRITSRRAQ